MKLSIHLFAMAKELANTDQIDVEIEVPATVDDVIAAVAQTTPELASLLPSCRLAVDDCYAVGDEVITAESDVALIPPVSGG